MRDFIAAREGLAEARRRFLMAPSTAALVEVDQAERALIVAWGRWAPWLCLYIVAATVLASFAAAWLAGRVP